MNCAVTPKACRERHYRHLMENAWEHPNTPLLAEILSSWQAGIGVLPNRLGLSAEQFDSLHRQHFGPATSHLPPNRPAQLDRRLDDLRQDLLRLMLAHAREDGNSPRWVAEIIATACQGSNHLWEDLGVWSRASLSALLQENFPSLAALNTRDMKWKKFLFKQLCEQEGVYICRAPTCDQCCDFDDCFGPE